MIYRPILTTLLLLPLTSYAFFCPTNFQQINYGYSPEKVLEICGRPDKQESSEIKPEGPQEWNYYKAQPSQNPMATNTAIQTSNTNQGGTIKAQMAFDSQSKLVNINVNGVTAAITTLCGVPIQLGDTREKVKAACGDPSIVHKSDATQNLPTKKVIIFRYQSTTPPVTLTFEDGKLAKRE